MADDAAYQVIAGKLRTAIESGELPEGAQLPSLQDLADRYGATRATAQLAVEALRAEGLIVTRHGAGAFVQRFARITRHSPGRLAREQWEAGHAIQDHDTGDRWRAVSTVVEEAPAPDFAAEAIGVAVGDLVLVRARRYEVDGRYVQLATSYLPLDITRGTAVAYTSTGPGGTYARLAELGYGPTRFVERVIARAPHPDEASQLAMPRRGALVVQVTRYAFAGDRCVEVNRMVLDATAYELVYDFSA